MTGLAERCMRASTPDQRVLGRAASAIWSTSGRANSRRHSYDTLVNTMRVANSGRT